MASDDYDSGDYASSSDERDTAPTPAEEEAARLAEEERKARLAIALTAAAQQQEQQLPTTLPTQAPQAQPQPGPGIPLMQQPYASSVPMPATPSPAPAQMQPAAPAPINRVSAPGSGNDMASYIATMQQNQLPQISADQVAQNQAASAQRQARDANWYKPGGEGSKVLGNFNPGNWRGDYEPGGRMQAYSRNLESDVNSESQMLKYQAMQKYRTLTDRGVPAAQAMAESGMDMFANQTGRRANVQQQPKMQDIAGVGYVYNPASGKYEAQTQPKVAAPRADPALTSAIASERSMVNSLEKTQSKVAESDPAFGQNSYLLHQHRTKLAQLEQQREQSKQAALAPPDTATGTTPAPVQRPGGMIYSGQNRTDAELEAQRQAILKARAVQVPATSGQSQRVTSQQQYDALPKGAIYIGKDGKRYRKP